VFAHLGYLNDLLGLPWLNLVYWTLAIEFQFYLFVGLAMPLIVRRTPMAEALLVAMLACAMVDVPSNFLSEQFGLFVLGIAAFRLTTGLSDPRSFAVMVALAAAGLAWTHGPLVATVSVATCCIIARGFVWSPAPLVWLGTISYSLYLLHVPIGGRVVNLGRRYIEAPWAELVLSLLALCVSIAAAWLLFRFVERPFMRASARIAFRRTALPADRSTSSV
jgi:peptidoglycan/LPS O-acetylase OafA/YrhL